MDSGFTRVRIVRCPRCLKLLVEHANITAYQCGGCGAALRAKNRTAAEENVHSGSLETGNSQGLSDIGSSDNGSTSSVNQMTAFSTSAHSSELEREEKQAMLPDIHSPNSSMKHNQENGESSGENGIEENGSDTNQLAVRIDASQSQPDESIHSTTEAEKSLNLSQQPSGSSNITNKVKGPPDSLSHSAASEEDVFERGSGDGLDLSFRSLATRSSHAYDGSISSSDDGYKNWARDRYLLLSRRTFKQPKALDATEIKGNEGEEVLGSNQVSIDLEADLQSRMRHGSVITRSFDMKRDELSSKYGRYGLEQESSFGSEDFHSAHNWMEPETDGPSRPLSRGSDFQHDFCNRKSSQYLRLDTMDLLRKVDELRNELRGLCNQRVEGEKPYFRGIDGRQPFYHKSEHQPPQYFKSNLFDRSPEALYGPRQIASQRYQFSQMPFSGQRCYSCLYRRLEDRQLLLQPNYCTDGMCRAQAYNFCSPSSTSGSSSKPDHEQEKLRYHEKRKPKRNRCRPIFGGSPFIICYNCFELLQLPADFLILRRRLHMLQCAACSEVLKLSFPAIARISPWTLSKVVHPDNEIDNCSDVAIGSVSHSNDWPQGDRVSFSEMHGPSTKSFSTEAERVLHVSRNTSVGKGDKEISGSPLHRLLGYSSASELLHKRWDIDEGYESIESMVPHSYRPSRESVIDGLRGRRTSISCHQQMGPCTNPDCMEIHEEE